MDIDEALDKYEDILDVAYHDDDWLTINLISEVLDDLRAIKRN